MNRPDYNIEFAHIYADEQFGNEQIKSIEILQEVISSLKKDNKTFVVSMLIDEFHPTIFRLNEGELLGVFKKYDVAVDFIGYESRLGVVADELIDYLPKSMLKFEHFHKPEKEVLVLKNNNGGIGLEDEFEFAYRHTCPLLSAAWSLCRLGVLKIPKDAVRNVNNKSFEAEKIITILPEKYRAVEDKVVEIIKSTQFSSAVQDIKYEFFSI